MKKLIFISVMVLMTVFALGQATPSADLRIANATTAFGINVPVGWKVYDLNAKKLYACDVASISTLTLTTGAANFTLIGGSGVGVGTVTSVGLALPSQITVSGSPVTGAGTLTGVWADTVANKVFAGPATGGAGKPQFRSLVAADIPALSYLTSEVDGSVTNEGSLTVVDGSGTADIHSNTSGSTNVTLAVSGLLTVDGAGSTITIASTAKTAIVEEYEVAGDSTGHCILTLTNTPVAGTVIVEMNGVPLKSTTQFAIVETKKVRMPFTVFQYEKFTISYSY